MTKSKGFKMIMCWQRPWQKLDHAAFLAQMISFCHGAHTTNWYSHHAGEGLHRLLLTNGSGFRETLLKNVKFVAKFSDCPVLESKVNGEREIAERLFDDRANGTWGV